MALQIVNIDAVEIFFVKVPVNTQEGNFQVYRQFSGIVSILCPQKNHSVHLVLRHILQYSFQVVIIGIDHCTFAVLLLTGAFHSIQDTQEKIIFSSGYPVGTFVINEPDAFCLLFFVIFLGS